MSQTNQLSKLRARLDAGCSRKHKCLFSKQHGVLIATVRNLALTRNSGGRHHPGAYVR